MVDKELLNRYFENQATGEEIKQAEEWLTDETNKEDILKYIENAYASSNGESAVRPFDEIFDKINADASPRAKIVSIKQKWIWGVSAACVLFLLLGGWIGYTLKDRSYPVNDWGMKTAQTGKGKFAQLTLSDGSEVYLGGDSKISFPVEMNVHPVVYLEGEAVFNLPDKNKTLTVKTRDLVTVARHSKFTISAFAKDSTVTVAVEKGKAEVSKNDEVHPMLKLRIPMMNLRIPAKDSASAKDTGKTLRKVIPMTLLTPAITIRENEQITYDKNSEKSDVSETKPNTLPLYKIIPLNQIKDSVKSDQ